MKKIFIFAFLVMLLFITGCQTQVTITFDSNGGTPVNSQTIPTGSTVTKPEDPIKEDVEFVGWYYNDKEWIFTAKVYSDMTLVAKYSDEEIEVKKTYIVTFFDYDGKILKEEEVLEGKSATAPEDPFREGYNFVGWSVKFDNVTSDLDVEAVYDSTVKQYTVIFMNYNGQTLKAEKVQSGKNATPPENPTRLGYVFTGWDGDYENVTSNITIRAKYISLNTEYEISYVMNNGIWGFSSKSEGVYYFLKDFYKFVSPSETIKEFIFGDSQTEYLGTWKNYIGGSYGDNNKLLYNNDLEARHEDYFFNCNQYREKWAPLGQWIASLNTRFNGTDYYYGTLDFYRYIINNPDQYINVYGQKFYSFPEMNNPFITYRYSDTDIILPQPLNDTFKGWYTNSDFTGEPVTKIPAKTYGDIELYACWDTTVTYEVSFNSDGAGTYDPVTLKFGDVITLPTPSKTGYTFLGWYLGDEYIGEELTFIYPFSVTLVAKYRNDTITLEQLSYDGTPVYYRNTSKVVEIPSGYEQPTAQLRASWVSSYASTFSPSPYENLMKANLQKLLDNFDDYNMNCMIFHIRTLNNAYYQTDLAPIDPKYGTYESFEQWDYLEWLISECHKRGIEFHAWLNPYRIKAYGYPMDATPETVALDYKDYPKNPASNPENILMTYRTDGTQGAILNPAKKEVQDYIVQVCLEVMEKYDVDAIHFDDYFYAQMSSGISVLTEPDQDDYKQYLASNPNSGYSVTSSTDKKQWRRDNIDAFIYKLSTAMTNFNKQNGRGVQLGISPTGIYRNGNGSVSSGSNTAGQEHYSSYLFCDTMKWVKNEWIDYIMPQSYWAFTHKVAGYADVMDWWNAAVEGTRVNLYSGIGLYMSISGGNYSWGVQPYELSNQILYTTKLKNVKGVSIYSHLSLLQVDSSPSRTAYKGLMRVKNEYWVEKVPTPQTMAHQYKKQ